MFMPENNARGAWAVAFVDDLVAQAGLLVLGFPVTTTTIRTIAASGGVISVAALQFVLRNISPMRSWR
jgi:hypothetical protein